MLTTEAKPDKDRGPAASGQKAWCESLVLQVSRSARKKARHYSSHTVLVSKFVCGLREILLYQDKSNTTIERRSSIPLDEKAMLFASPPYHLFSYEIVH